MATLSLAALRKHIVHQQSQLQALRKELEARQARLASLTNRKKGLQAQLQQVEKEIAALARGVTTVAAPKPAQAKATVARRPAPGKHPASLADLIVVILREAGRPRPVRELAAEAKRRGVPSASRDFRQQVQNRVYDLKIKRLIAPASGQPGYVLRGTPAKVGPNTSTGKSREQPTLREVVTQILAKVPKPLTRGQLAAEALKAGYRSKSKDLANVIGVQATMMSNVEHVRGEGFRLRKGEA